MSSDTPWSVPKYVPGLDPAVFFRRLEWALSTFSERGVKLPDSCRARRSLQVLRDLANETATEHKAPQALSFDQLVAHQRTAFDLIRCTSGSTPFTKSKLQEVVLGPEFTEGRDRSARNTQFELVTAARFCLGGVEVLGGEPDLIISYGGESVGIAVKRVTSHSVNQIRKRMRDAQDQIARTSLRGIVAVNLEGRLPPLPPTATTAEIMVSADAAYGPIDRIAEEFLSDDRLLGIIAFDSLLRPALHRSPNRYPAIDSTTPVKYWLFGNLTENAFGNYFFAQWRERWLATLLSYGSWFAVEDT
jgi:hypothetical protein